MHPLILLLFIWLQICVKFTSCTSRTVIIVGAGPAGVAAATRLLEHDFNNLTVLEAENRVGGRINSVFFGDAFVELGAEWCHGQKGNIVHDLVKDMNILRHTEFTTDLYHSSKKKIDKEFTEELMNVMASFQRVDDDKYMKDDSTLGHYLINIYNATIHEKYSRNSEKLDLAKESMQLFRHYSLSLEGALNWFDASAGSDYIECEGDQDLNWNGLGYKTILEVLMKKFPDPSKQLPFDEKVLLNKEVVKVSWNESSVVTVECSDGTAYEADHVIFTPSIGVLKAQHEKIFTPPLPTQKKNAIKQIGIGAVMKVVMHFKQKWWESDNPNVLFIWGENDEIEVSKEFPEGPVKDGRSWLTELYEIISAERNPNVLIAWLTGDMIPEIELISDEVMIDGIMFTLNKFMGHKFNITRPDSILRTRWYTSPHFRGTYSYQTVEARKGNNVTAEMELAKPLLNAQGVPIVMFAGEASHPYLFSMVQGAIETGHREADRIINLYK